MSQWAQGVDGELERTEARGRNGWIKARRYKVYAFPATRGQREEVWLNLWSGRQGRTAPVQIRLSPADARRLGLAIGLAAEDLVEEVAG